jgi:hypothetical protein
MDPSALSALWPKAVADRINNKTARVIHIPFRKEPVADAISQFDYDNPPKSPLSYYSRDVYTRWGFFNK